MRTAIWTVLAAFLTLSSCTTAREAPSDMLTVTGSVTVRGNEPFAKYVLLTEDSNYYVLAFPDSAYPETPDVVTVTGRLYQGTWDGRPFAHIEVQSIDTPPATLR